MGLRTGKTKVCEKKKRPSTGLTTKKTTGTRRKRLGHGGAEKRKNAQGTRKGKLAFPLHATGRVHEDRPTTNSPKKNQGRDNL